ncbi:MAG: MFS transporter [Lentisphaeria bacterium]|nr:MFS transporter [Lentisphaeria bacterium]
MNGEVVEKQYRRSLFLTLAGVTCWAVFGSVSTGSLLSGLLLSLGFTDQQIGYATALCQLCLLLQLPGAILQARFVHRKVFWLTLGTLGYSLFGAIGFLALFWQDLPPVTGVIAFMVLYGLCNVALQMTTTVVMAWKSDIPPPGRSNHYWTLHTGFGVVCSMLFWIVLGYCADMLGRHDSRTYFILIMIATVAAYLSMVFQAFIPDPEAVPSKNGPRFLPQLKEVICSGNFRKLTGFFSIQMFGKWLMSGFVFIFMQAEMGFSQFSIQLLLMASAAFGILAGFLFRRVADRYGRKPAVMIFTGIKVVEFVLWGTLMVGNQGFDFFCLNILEALHIPTSQIPPGFLSALPAMCLSGFVNMGLAAGQIAMLTSDGSKANKSITMSLFFMILGAVGAISSAISGELSTLFTNLNTKDMIGLMPFNLLSLCGAACYCISMFLIARYQENGALPTHRVLMELIIRSPMRLLRKH